MKRAMKAAAFAQGDVYLASSIPLVIQFKVMACDTQIAVG
jgi:hypothetical protein